MSNIIKNSIIIGLFMSFFTYNIVFSQGKSNFNAAVLNAHNESEIIYLLDDEGNLIKLNHNHNDVIPDNLPKLSSIYVNDNNFVGLTKDNKIVSSFNSSFLKDKNISKIDKLFLLTLDGEVTSFTNKISKKLKSFKNIKDIKALSEEVVLMEENDGTYSIVGDNTGGIGVIKKINNVSQVEIYDNDLILIIKKDGTVVGVGDRYDSILPIVEQIKNAKKFIKQEDNLYVVTFDNKAIPIIENDFKAPKEYLNDITDIVIDKYASGKNILYRAYFITSKGNIFHHIQSNNEISDFSENKIKYINTFNNVETVYESGYLTIVLHRDGSITIPYDINHELNGLTGVKKVILKNQTYVVYLEDGQVITSLDNFILNKKYYEEPVGENTSLYNYLNKLYINILNKKIDEGKFEVAKYSIGNSKEELENFITRVCLNRNFLVLGDSYNDIIYKLYNTILNENPSPDEYNHMEHVIIDNMVNDKEPKIAIVKALLEYIYENPIFDNIVNKLI